MVKYSRKPLVFVRGVAFDGPVEEIAMAERPGGGNSPGNPHTRGE